METTRLILRHARVNDVNDIYEMLSSDHVLKYNMMSFKTMEQVKDLVIKNSTDESVYYLELKDSNKVIGEITLSKDELRYGVHAISISYYLHEKYVKKGYMFEALTQVLSRLFNQDHYQLVSARVFADNDASLGLLKKLGFVQEGLLRKAVVGYRNILHDDVLFSLLAEDY